MNEPYASLLQLQELDQEIVKAQARVEQFSPRLNELRGPSTGLERELAQTRSKLEELRTQARKLEHGAENKREKLRMFEERVSKSRSIRDEAATRTEMDLIRRAVEAEIAEGQDTNDQVRRHDMRVDELEKSLAKMRDEIRPQEEQIETERTEAEQQLRILQDKRGNHVLHMDKVAVRLYERVHAGKRKTALAPLTLDGACGSCYNVLPMQEQSEIRQGAVLRRCEACGVILYPPNA
jgi:predicted  nucleic acid-binding Zn-ribbon protein